MCFFTRYVGSTAIEKKKKSSRAVSRVSMETSIVSLIMEAERACLMVDSETVSETLDLYTVLYMDDLPSRLHFEICILLLNITSSLTSSVSYNVTQGRP
jgi:hypothetical protein